MAKSSNGIDITIFSACKVSEKSKIPVLFLANPGVGKSTGVEMFSKVRGYELILLRGNTETNESIMGYSVCPPDAKENSSVIQLRPSWFQQLLDNHNAGKKSLLFLDEITTANEYTQAALLHLIFERKCGVENIPSDTLIIAAGNYANNLSNSMVMLPPLLTRFMIINLTPTANDLTDFLNKYDGSISGNRKDHFKELMDTMKALDEQEIKDLDTNTLNKIGEYVERNIRMVTKMLMTSGEKPIDLKVTELQNVYSDVDNDRPLANVVNLRTLNYFREVTIAEYICFGKAGIKSDIYANMVNGLVGLGVSRDSNNDVKYTSVTGEYFDSMANVVNDIEKMSNNKLPAFVEFFNGMIKDPSSKKKEDTLYTVAEINTITNKLKELKGDNEISKLDRPIDGEVITKICDSLVTTAKSVCKIKIDSAENISDKISAEKFGNLVTNWNYIADLITEFNGLVLDPAKNYEAATKDHLNNEVRTILRNTAFRIKSARKALIYEDKAFEHLIPEIKTISK
jgi:MoxR-like ATPase